MSMAATAQEKWSVQQGTITIDSETSSFVLPVPCMTQASRLYYLVATVKDYSSYYTEDQSGTALGYLRVNNGYFPTTAGSITYIFYVKSDGSGAAYQPNGASFTTQEGGVLCTNTKARFAAGMQLDYIVVFI